MCFVSTTFRRFPKLSNTASFYIEPIHKNKIHIITDTYNVKKLDLIKVSRTTVNDIGIYY
jgi:hypothetical protein